ncbi:hypothetical protein [Paraburkholderia antibiotica]|uniref:Uncharacterized protein n=1 Tax=Paraburkholderia antibiotica TaxID=2728839 RepID=A0A7Y0A0H2_9BURK|nr:hypothetical protein [Paraburkholderia antibiotica]NML34242.1 hypothetical protein [Paraburkholderia antibiotica]
METTLNAGNSLTVASGHDINVIGSTINLGEIRDVLVRMNELLQSSGLWD